MTAKKTKIIHVPRRFVREEWGGTETVIIETSCQLEKAGYEPEIFTSTALCDKKQETVYGIQVRRFPYIYARLGLKKHNRQLLDRRGGNVLSFSFFLALLRCKDVKLVHLHTGGRLGAFVRLAAKIKKFPYVLSIHGGLLELPPKQLEELVAPMKGSFNWGKIFDLILGASKVEKDAAAIICVSRKEQELVSAKYPDKKVIYLENGVDVEHFASGNAQIFRDKFGIENEKIILCVASFNPQKNQIFLIESFNKIHKLRPECKLVMIGTVYDQDYYKEVLAKIKDYGLEDSVILIPNLPFDNDTLLNAYAACDIFVLPSLYEPFGIVILEAWAADKPVACSGTGGMKYFVRDNENALIFDKDSPEDAAEKISHILEDEPQTARLVAAGKVTAEKHSWETISQKLISLYEEL